MIHIRIIFQLSPVKSDAKEVNNNFVDLCYELATEMVSMGKEIPKKQAAVCFLFYLLFASNFHYDFYI